MFFTLAAPDDWVVTRREVLYGFTGRLAAGARGVVLSRTGWNSLVVRFDISLGGRVAVRVPAADVRVVRRQGGVDRFDERAARLARARAGVAIALLAGYAYFVLAWYFDGGSDAGLAVALINGAMYGAFDMLNFVVPDTTKAILLS